MSTGALDGAAVEDEQSVRDVAGNDACARVRSALAAAVSDLRNIGTRVAETEGQT